MNTPSAAIAGAMACLAITAGLAFAAQNVKLTPQDQKLLDNLARGNIAEVQLAALAEQRAASPAVREFAKRMIEDHSAMRSQLQQWASANAVVLPSTASDRDLARVKRFEKLTGKDFDRQYIQVMLRDHRDDVTELREFLEAHPNTKVKPVIANTLPIIENHLRVAENVAGQIGVAPELGLNRPEHPSAV
jgi:putative membrane protein